MTVKSIIISRPDDWHVHFRDGDILKTVVPFTSKFFGRAVVMPNLTQPVINNRIAKLYRKRIIDAVNSEHQFSPLMVFQLTDNIILHELVCGFENGLLTACKLYPINKVANPYYGVTDIKKIYNVLSVIEDLGIPLLVHGEIYEKYVDVFDYESEFIKYVMIPLRLQFPKLKIVFEHITTKEAARYVLDSDEFVAATITPQHLMFNRNKMFIGGIKPHFYCLPLLKSIVHQKALLDAIKTGCDRFFLGTDTAPHLKIYKESSCGCAGVFSSPIALALYATVFEKFDMLKYFEAFCSFNGPKFYNLPVNKNFIMLTKKENIVCDSIFCCNDKLIPFLAGEKLSWSASVIK
ncbi:Dihydroorotase [Candidatus Providencia siddallii]|uniref:Dihydroorotase n=1 Tax=Candidatus Providencia siddallii TaxID=1715285 RepID=A0A0M6W740_9GAMM|nr:Dihydroorotase [Candidatus Providencia siddallii]